MLRRRRSPAAPTVRGGAGDSGDLVLRSADGTDFSAFFAHPFGRTAGTEPRGPDFPFREHVEKMNWDQVAKDVGPAVAWLRGLEGGRVDSMFTVGFCLGGALSWRQSAVGSRARPARVHRFLRPPRPRR